MKIALIGLPGSGKSKAADFLKEKGFSVVRLGDITDEKLIEQGKKINEENEKVVRENLREEYGKGAYALLNLEKIKKNKDVVIDGMRSFEELEIFRKEFPDLKSLLIKNDEKIRHERMMNRKVRPLSKTECFERDKRELEILGVRETMKHVDLIVENNGSFEEFKENLFTQLSL